MSDNRKTINYQCETCLKTFKQKSHYMRHRNRKNPCKLPIDIKTIENIICQTIKKQSIKVDKKEKIHKKINELENQRKKKEVKNSNQENVVWTAPINDMDDSKELAVVDAIKRCHSITYSEGIVGEKAMNDIMCIVSLQQLEKLIENNIIELNVNKKLRQKKEFVYFSYLKNLQDHDLRNDDKSDGIRRAGKILSNHPLLKQIFTRANFLHMKKARNIRKVFDIISNLDLQIDDPAGAIYMTFITDYFKSGSKLGQFFTPRKLIKLINNGLIPEDLLKSLNIQTIMDNFMGTAGFIVYMRKRLQELGINIEPENINGIEVEPDTYKYAFLNMLLTTGRNCENLNLADSLAENTMNQKADFIQTNPPFGLKMNYKNLMESYEDKELFKRVFPIKTNDGTALCLQSMIYRTKKIGIIVLPDGKLFFGKNEKKIRKWMCENINILKILKVPGGSFEHTGISTAIILFTKSQKTNNITFYKTSDNCNNLKSVCNINIKDLKENNYSFDSNDYIEDEYITNMKKGNIKWFKFEDICNVKSPVPGFLKITSYYDKNGTIPIIRGLNLANKKTEMMYLKEEARNLIKENKKIKKGDVMIPYFGTNCKIAEKSWIGNPCYNCLRLTEFKNTTNKYVYYFVCSDIFKNMKIKKSKGGCASFISRNMMENLEIPVPSIEVQNEIVEQLESLEKQKQNFENSIEFTKKEMEFYMNCKIKKACKNNCEWKPIKDLFNFDKKSKRKASYGKDTGNYKFYKCSEKVMKCEESDYKEERLLICDGGNPMMHIDNNFSCSSHNHILYTKDSDLITNIFTYYYLYLNRNSGIIKMKGMTIKNISKSTVEKIKIPVIDMKLQNIIVNYLNNRQNEINNLEIRKTQIDELMKEILESSFSGDSNEESSEEEKVEENESE
jgi:type I restriction-modification system DNA methylase subunit